jgi:hypothetical protein
VCPMKLSLVPFPLPCDKATPRVPCLSPQRFRHSDSYLYSGAAFS